MKQLEYFDIRDKNGDITGEVKERSLVHQDGDLHGTVHIWVVRKTTTGYDVLLQKRSATKDSFPECYDISSAGHVEAGLRTHNIYSPWPEEMNRQITGRIAAYNFAPTEKSKESSASLFSFIIPLSVTLLMTYLILFLCSFMCMSVHRKILKSRL